MKPWVEKSHRFLRADFGNLQSTVGPRSQLESCSIMDIVCPVRVSTSLGQWNDLWKENSENWSVVVIRTCISKYVMKKDDLEEMPN